MEFIDAGDKPTPLAVMVSALTAILAKVCSPVPAFPGHFNDAILALTQILPIGVDIDRLRIATAQPDNGDRFGCVAWARSSALTAKASAPIQPGLGLVRVVPPVNALYLAIAVFCCCPL